MIRGEPGELTELHDIYIDKDGLWYFHGKEMKRQDIVRHLYQYLKRDGAGRYVIETETDRCYVKVEDAPFVIKGADAGFSQHDGQPCILVSLSDGSREELDLGIPLWHGEDNVLYCRVKKGEYAARFSRPAYYQFCGYIEHDAARGIYMVTVNGSSYPLAFTDQP
jgi:hypothetical protein